MSYQTAIRDDFVPQQFRDDKWIQAKAHFDRPTPGRRLKTQGPWVIALPRPDLHPASRTRIDMTDMVKYTINAKINVVALMHVVAVGTGRVRLGYREIIPVEPGDLVLVNLREAGHWMNLHGTEFYCFTGDVAIARVYRTAKTITPPLDPVDWDRWNDELYWNIKDVLNDYVICGRDPVAERAMMQGPEKLVWQSSDAGMTDGTRSDDMRDNRFPMVYRRVLGAGPGRCMRRESDLGIIEREETISVAQPGDMICYAKSVAAADFTFQGMPLQAIHCASGLVIEHGDETFGGTGARQTIVHESVPQPIPWVDPDDTEEDADPEAAGRAVA